MILYLKFKAMMRFAFNPLFFISCVSLSACQSIPNNNTDFDIHYDFSHLKYFSWFPKNDNKSVMTLQQKREYFAINTILTHKGFIQSSIKKADFLLKTEHIVDKKKEAQHFFSYWGYFPEARYSYRVAPFVGMNHLRPSVGREYLMEREYIMETFILKIIDAKTQEVIWRSAFSQKQNFYLRLPPNERNNKITQKIQHILNDFTNAQP
jgi:hypothetical protein